MKYKPCRPNSQFMMMPEARDQNRIAFSYDGGWNYIT